MGGTTTRLAAVLMGSAVVVAACGSSSSGSSSGGTASGDFVIGMMTVLSGPAADISALTNRGANLAAADANAAGGVHGRHVRIEFCDNGNPQGVSDPNKSIACAQKFANEGIPATAVTDEGSLAHVVNLFTQKKIFAVGGYSDDYDKPDQYPYVFSLVSSTAVGGYETATRFLQKGYHNVATISDNTASEIASTRIFDDQLRKAGLNVVDDENVGLADVDVSAQTSKVIAAHPDVVFINTYGLVAAHLMQNFNDAKVSFPVWGSGAFSNTPVVLLLGLSSIPNLYLETFTSATVKPAGTYTPQLQHLVNGILADGKGKVNPAGTIFLAMYGYDLISMLTHAYSNASSTDPATVKTAFEQMTLTRAAGQIYTDDIKFSPGHHKPLCDPQADNVSFGRLADQNGVLTESDPPLGSCPPGT